MELTPEKKWIYLYTLPCHNGSESVFEHILAHGEGVRRLKKDHSREAVMAHFLIDHNLTNPNFHYCVPYVAGKSFQDSLPCIVETNFLRTFDITLVPSKIFDKKTLEEAIQRGALSSMPSPETIIIAHGNYVVDTATERELERVYSSFRKRFRR